MKRRRAVVRVGTHQCVHSSLLPSTALYCNSCEKKEGGKFVPASFGGGVVVGVVGGALTTRPLCGYVRVVDKETSLASLSLRHCWVAPVGVVMR
jgi:hypothetical protein